MDALAWAYAGEGGKHAIFQYIGTGEWEGQVIRLKKSDICGSAVNARMKRDDSTAFVRDIVIPLLSPYVDLPQEIQLPWDFVVELRQQALASRMIPSARMKSWNIALQQFRNNQVAVPATLLWNYKCFPGDSCAGCLSLEIKPKAGYLAISPLVSHKNRAKHKYSRFAILQDLAAKGIIKKGWQSEEDFLKSAYNPLDFFSGESERIIASLRNLFVQPQNNLKAWYENRELFGISEKHPDYEHFSRKAAREIFGCGINYLEMQLIPLLAEILVQETLLSALLRLQKLDIIDADGAILIFNHLLELYHGDFDAVNRVLSEQPVLISTNDRQSKQGPRILESPFKDPNCPTLKALTDEIQNFAKNLIHNQMDKTAMDLAYERAITCVTHLSKEASVFLIQNWLFSLAISDVSLFVSIRRADGFQSPHDWPSIEDEKHCILCPQSDIGPGLVGKLTMVDGKQDFQKWAYSIKLVDCDNKPVSKLECRAKEETMIQFFQS